MAYTTERQENVYFFTVQGPAHLDTYLCRAFALEDAMAMVKKDHPGKITVSSGIIPTEQFSVFLAKDIATKVNKDTKDTEDTVEEKTEQQIKSMVKFLKSKGYKITK